MLTASAKYLIDFALLLGAHGPWDMSSPPIVDCSPVITAASPSASRPWVQVENPCNTTLDTSDVVLRWAGDTYGWGAAKIPVMMGPGACYVATEFDQPLLTGEKCAAGIGLFSSFDDANVDEPFFGVSYGFDTCELPWTGGDIDVEPPSASESLMLIAGEWIVVEGNEPGCPRPGPSSPPDDWRLPPNLCPLAENMTDSEISVLCAKHPMGRGAACGELPSVEACIDYMHAQQGCGLTRCEYAACMEALETADCTDAPAACQGITSCTN